MDHLLNGTVATPRVDDHTLAQTGSRTSGAIAAAVIASSAALVGLVFDTPFLALGIPAATVAGWLLGPSVRASRSIAGPGMTMASVTVVVADLMLIAGNGVLTVVRDDPYGASSLLNALAGSVLIFLIGLLIVGLPMLLITVPCGLVWAAVVRRLVPTGNAS